MTYSINGRQFTLPADSKGPSSHVSNENALADLFVGFIGGRTLAR
jgi:hypothetical protein